jgi:hypothetical protein
MSYNDCHTWPVACVVHEGRMACSDLFVAPVGSICCLYEPGEEHPYEKLTLARRPKRHGRDVVASSTENRRPTG